MIHGCIYALSDSREPEILRYIGKTTGPLGPRLARHRYATTARRDLRQDVSHRANWIRKVIREGGRILISRLDTAQTSEALREEERWWIANARAVGFPLTNCSEGGEGDKRTEDFRARISEAVRKEWKRPGVRKRRRASMSASAIRRWHPEVQ